MRHVLQDYLDAAEYLHHADINKIYKRGVNKRLNEYCGY